MKLRIRSKADGRVRVYDEQGNEIAGIVYVAFSAEGDEPGTVTIRCRADIAVDAEQRVGLPLPGTLGDLMATTKFVGTSMTMTVEPGSEDAQKLDAIIADEKKGRSK